MIAFSIECSKQLTKSISTGHVTEGVCRVYIANIPHVLLLSGSNPLLHMETQLSFWKKLQHPLLKAFVQEPSPTLQALLQAVKESRKYISK